MGSLLSRAKYLVRIDDVCPTMDWGIWNQMEASMEEMGVKPILAVVPDNQDPKLIRNPPAPDFWDKVRAWQAKGWAIGLHGFQHDYVTQDSGILNLNQKSEFAGLTYEEQLRKLRLAIEVFTREGVRVDAWVAPSHSFDWATVEALHTVGITVISDGYAFSPYRDEKGITWVPQQFAHIRWMPFGVWTCCHHPDLKPEEQPLFRNDMLKLRGRFISLPEAVAMGDRRLSPLDGIIRLVREAVTFGRALIHKRH